MYGLAKTGMDSNGQCGARAWGGGKAGVAGKETQQGVPTSRCLTYCHIEVPPSPTLC